MLALHRFLVDLGRLIEEDYQRNKYNPDVQDVRAFRVTRLVEFLDDDSEGTADDMTDVPRNDMHTMI